MSALTPKSPAAAGAGMLLRAEVALTLAGSASTEITAAQGAEIAAHMERMATGMYPQDAAFVLDVGVIAPLAARATGVSQDAIRVLTSTAAALRVPGFGAGLSLALRAGRLQADARGAHSEASSAFGSFMAAARDAATSADHTAMAQRMAMSPAEYLTAFGGVFPPEVFARYQQLARVVPAEDFWLTPLPGIVREAALVTRALDATPFRMPTGVPGHTLPQNDPYAWPDARAGRLDATRFDDATASQVVAGATQNLLGGLRVRTMALGGDTAPAPARSNDPLDLEAAMQAATRSVLRADPSVADGMIHYALQTLLDATQGAAGQRLDKGAVENARAAVVKVTALGLLPDDADALQALTRVLETHAARG